MPEVKEHPQLFKAEMVRAILDGRKTMTRRAVTQNNSLLDGTGKGIRAHWKHLDWSRAFVDPGPSPAGNPGPYWKVPCSHLGDAEDLEVWHRIYPRVQAGDALWVKETWLAPDGPSGQVHYKATTPHPLFKWKSPLHMPRDLTRLVLPVVRVGAERLQEITEADAIAEGVDWKACSTIPEETKGGVIHQKILYRTGFKRLWDSINGDRPGLAWKDSPPLWVYEWPRHEGASG